jgi:hypothetical protein
MILVFKTSVSTFSEVETLKPQLDKHFPNAKWNFDLQDCDNILRIENLNEITKEIIKLLNQNNYMCEALVD